MSSLPVFELIPDFGVSIKYEFNNEVHESVSGKTYVNALWEQPIAKITFNKGWLSQTEYDYVKQFYESVNGSAGKFLFIDPIDYKVTNTHDIGIDGSYTQGVVYEVGGLKFLGKKYCLGSSEIIRPITRPMLNTVVLYDGINTSNAIVDVNTGIVTGDATTWSGNFYIPCSFDNNLLPLSIIGYDSDNNEQIYDMSELIISERKEGLNVFNQSINIVDKLNRYFELPLPINTQINRLSKTSIFSSDSGFDSRTSTGINRTEIQIPSFILENIELKYLICYNRLMLGDWGAIKFKDNESNIDNFFRNKSPLSFQVLLDSEKEYEDPLYRVQDFSLIQDDDGLKSSYCHIWQIQKTTGELIGYTNHDREIFNSGLFYGSNTGFSASSSSKSAKLNTDNFELSSAFIGAVVTNEELLSGQYDTASIIVSMYDWFNNIIVSRLSTGFMGGYSIGYLKDIPKDFSLEGLSIIDRLDTSVVKKTSSNCRHNFLSQGYGKCNRVIDSSVRQSTTIVGIVNNQTFTLGIQTVPFNLGILTFTSGIYINKSFFIASAINDQITLAYSIPVLPSIGDSCFVTKFCNKSIDACKSFDNAKNFGGQPYLPGFDKTIAKADD